MMVPMLLRPTATVIMHRLEFYRNFMSEVESFVAASPDFSLFILSLSFANSFLFSTICLRKLE